jgi:hypothetical protein
MNKSYVFILALSLCLATVAGVKAQTGNTAPWPREIKLATATVIVYQPQPEKFDGNSLQGRVAVSVQTQAMPEPVFGAVWLSAILETDLDERTAMIKSVKVLRIHFPEQTEEKAKNLAALLAQEIPKWQLPISLDQLSASLELAENRSQAVKKINNDPPEIIFVSHPAILVTLDGEPRLTQIEGSGLMRVSNTPFTIILDSAAQTYYLYAAKKAWYSAKDIKGKWSRAQQVPSTVAALAPLEPPAE